MECCLHMLGVTFPPHVVESLVLNAAGKKNQVCRGLAGAEAWQGQATGQPRQCLAHACAWPDCLS